MCLKRNELPELIQKNGNLRAKLPLGSSPKTPSGNKPCAPPPSPAVWGDTRGRGATAGARRTARDAASRQDGAGTGGCGRGEGGEGGGTTSAVTGAALPGFPSPTALPCRGAADGKAVRPLVLQPQCRGQSGGPRGRRRTPGAPTRWLRHLPSPRRPRGGAPVCFTVLREDGRPRRELQNLTYVYELPHAREAGHVLSACGRGAGSSCQPGRFWPPGCPPPPAQTPPQMPSEFLGQKVKTTAGGVRG